MNIQIVVGFVHGLVGDCPPESSWTVHQCYWMLMKNDQNIPKLYTCIYIYMYIYINNDILMIYTYIYIWAICGPYIGVSKNKAPP